MAKEKKTGNKSIKFVVCDRDSVVFGYDKANDFFWLHATDTDIDTDEVREVYTVLNRFEMERLVKGIQQLLGK